MVASTPVGPTFYCKGPIDAEDWGGTTRLTGEMALAVFEKHVLNHNAGMVNTVRLAKATRAVVTQAIQGPLQEGFQISFHCNIDTELDLPSIWLFLR